jgi:hypothetical protein
MSIHPKKLKATNKVKVKPLSSLKPPGSMT